MNPRADEVDVARIEVEVAGGWGGSILAGGKAAHHMVSHSYIFFRRGPFSSPSNTRPSTVVAVILIAKPLESHAKRGYSLCLKCH